MQAARSALRRLATSHMPEKTGKHVRQMSGGAVSHEEVRGSYAWGFLGPGTEWRCRSPAFCVLPSRFGPGN